MMREYAVFHIIALAAGILGDLLIGDPHGIPHPVRAIGHLITALEKRLYDGDTSRACRTEAEQKRMKRRGTLLWGTVLLVTAFFTGLILVIAYRTNLYAGAAVEAVLTCWLLAAGSLQRESMEVGRVLRTEGTDAARKPLSMIVGRDTKELDESGIIRAAVETVAENTSDGVIAPLLAAAVGGPVLGWIYKAVNTMDSMLGYHNERYEYFGRTAARADDVFNYIPSRISAVFMILAAYITGVFSKRFSGRNALRIWRRDRRNHLSPNSAQTESVCAGALGLRLGGTHTYNGVPVEKPMIGDDDREPEDADIGRANVLMLVTEAITAAVVLGIWIIIISM